jgi:GT2 family glycosyltransferase
VSAPDADAALPPVTVLLLNWNGWRDTVECLESLFRLDYPRWNVIVCDNASTDDSVDRIRSWANGQLQVALETPVTLRHLVDPPVAKPIPFGERSAATGSIPGSFEPRSVSLMRIDENLGFAGGNNVGLRHLMSTKAAKYVWILNNDVVVAPDSLTRLIACAEADTRIGGVGGTLYEYSDPSTIQNRAGGRFAAWQGVSVPLKQVRMRVSARGDREQAIDFLSGTCLLAPIEVIRRVGLIDEKYFMYAEDVDYSLRIRDAGFSLAYAPDASVWHKGGASTVHRSAAHDYYIVRNSLHLVRKYHPNMLPIATLYIGYQCVLPKVARREWARLAVLRNAYRDFRAGVFGPMPVPPAPSGS